MMAEEKLTAAAFRRLQRGKNLALGLIVGALAVLFFVITLVRMGGQ